MKCWLRRNTGALMIALCALTILFNAIPADTVALLKAPPLRPLLRIALVIWGIVLLAAWFGAIIDYQARRQDVDPPSSAWYPVIFGLFVVGAAIYYVAVMRPANRRGTVVADA